MVFMLSRSPIFIVFIVLFKQDPSRTTRRQILFFGKLKIDFFETVDVPVWHFEVNFRILVCQLVIYLYVYVLCICNMYMHYVYVLCICICILYSVYVLCNENKKKGTTSSTIITGSWWHGGVGKTQIQQRRQHTQGRQKRRPTS